MLWQTKACCSLGINFNSWPLFHRHAHTQTHTVSGGLHLDMCIGCGRLARPEICRYSVPNLGAAQVPSCATPHPPSACFLGAHLTISNTGELFKPQYWKLSALRDFWVIGWNSWGGNAVAEKWAFMPMLWRKYGNRQFVCTKIRPNLYNKVCIRLHS